ncbi:MULTISPECIES: phosphotransferase [unclassified Variovorax]|uniref:phosphotransferase n=1 Tax=unclassified Variovorax TaxID=663243 RepID=UPI001BD50FB5|nr:MULTISPECIES: phosphotransferase [unclassified Variovorax]
MKRDDCALAPDAEPVREAFRFDEQRLTQWLLANVDDDVGTPQVSQFKGGQSNPTYRVDTARCSYVLRRKPPGDLLKGAHAIDREYRALAALREVDFPVPWVHALCLDRGVIGTEFYVMDHVEGRVFWNPRLPEVPAPERAAYFDAMNETIACLHGIDPATIGLADYGRAGGYFERQIARWSGQYRDDALAGRDPNMDRLVEWLPQNVPAGDETAISHGDFRCDNMIFHPTEPRVLAVLDWELSTLGHPLADFSYHAMMYRLPPSIMNGLLGEDLALLGLPSEADYIAAYARRTGRNGIPGYAFYIAFNMFRLAAILHGIKGRLLRGTASSARAVEMATNVEPLALLAWQQAEIATREAG